jgi:hypothetical protein
MTNLVSRPGYKDSAGNAMAAVSIDLCRHSASFDLTDAWNGDVYNAGQSYSALRWSGAGFGLSAGSNTYTVIAAVRVNPASGVPDNANLGCLFGTESGSSQHLVVASASPVTAGLKDGFDESRGYAVSGTDLGTAYILGNRPSRQWAVVALRQNGASLGLFVNGAMRPATVNSYTHAGVTLLGLPYYTRGHFAGGVGWPTMRLAALWAWGRVLSDQELLDFYGMLTYGAGYAISRKDLALWWLARRDSTTPGHIQTLPAWTAWNVKRTTIPDLSGNGRHGDLYSGDNTARPDWPSLLGGTDADSAIYVPQAWADDNPVYDGANPATKRVLRLQTSGAVFE